MHDHTVNANGIDSVQDAQAGILHQNPAQARGQAPGAGITHSCTPHGLDLQGSTLREWPSPVFRRQAGMGSVRQ